MIHPLYLTKYECILNFEKCKILKLDVTLSHFIILKGRFDLTVKNASPDISLEEQTRPPVTRTDIAPEEFLKLLFICEIKFQ